MNSQRIKDILKTTAYPESLSVHQALLQVWNECQRDRLISEKTDKILKQFLVKTYGDFLAMQQGIKQKLSTAQSEQERYEWNLKNQTLYECFTILKNNEAHVKSSLTNQPKKEPPWQKTKF